LSLAELREVERANLSAFFHELLRDLGELFDSVRHGEEIEKRARGGRRIGWRLERGNGF